MKRPAGYGSPERGQPTPPGRKPVRPASGRAPRRQPERAPEPTQPKPRRDPSARPAPRIRPATQVRPDAAARAELRRAVRDRKRAERAEMRRFTRRDRNRRLAAATVGATVLTLMALVLTAVFSPILALREVRVDGTSRVDPALVTDAIDDQLGTPLALLDHGRIGQAMTAFPLIRDYVVEIVPPGTLLVHVTERQPVAQLAVGGAFRMVDPAGVTIQESTERTPGMPVIDLGAGGVDSPGFAAVVEVLLALPPELAGRVDRASATTRDDVTLVLAGVGQAVTWGSADDSAQKAALLEGLIANIGPDRPGTFDVSAPTNGIFHPA